MKNLGIKKVYLIGIKGAGMTALAEILQSRGIEVIGSDTKEKFYTDEILKNRKINFFEGFLAEQVAKDADVVIYSSAYSQENNVEMSMAASLNIPMLSYSEMLGNIFAEKKGIAVCGTHGKTTTSAMLAQALKVSGVDPVALVGSKVINWQSSVLCGQGEYFVAESDEYQNKLQHYNPWSAILTSVDWDHPDFFPNFEVYKKTFKDFVKKIPQDGFLVAWGDSSDAVEVASAATCQVLKYGFAASNDYVIINNKQLIADNINSQTFEVYFKDELLGQFETPLSGKHNILNATAVIAMAHAMGQDLAKIKTGLKEFQGTSRRFEYIGKYKDALLIDDYAHHPDEIKATLSGAKERFAGKKIWTVFHPHTFTRTKALLSEFSRSFGDADKVIVIDIYGSAREQQGGVSSSELASLINEQSTAKAQHVPTIEDAVEFLKEKSGEYDVLISMGAGDVWRVVKELKN